MKSIRKRIPGLRAREREGALRVVNNSLLRKSIVHTNTNTNLEMYFQYNINTLGKKYCNTKTNITINITINIHSIYFEKQYICKTHD